MSLYESVELAVPFRVAADGAIATVTDPNAIVKQHVVSVVGTQRGERVMLPSYGVNIQRFLFSNNDPSLNVLLTTEIDTALKDWVPEAKLTSARMETDEQEGIGHISITYTNISSSNPSQTVTLSVNPAGQ